MFKWVSSALNLTRDVPLSAREKRRKREAPMPAASAGLLRFFEEETPGIKVRPEVVLMLSIGLIAISLFAYLTFK
jgi:preprotein translocase subunit Sec61beta